MWINILSEKNLIILWIEICHRHRHCNWRFGIDQSLVGIGKVFWFGISFGISIGFDISIGFSLVNGILGFGVRLNNVNHALLEIISP